MEGIAEQIINNAKIALDATELQLEYGAIGREKFELPEMLENKNGK